MSAQPASFAAAARAPRPPVPPFLDVRFNAAARPLPDSGATIIGHTPVPVRDALIGVVDALQATPGARRFAWLPPSSYHMTLYDGLLHRRRAPAFWPAALAPDAPAPQADAWFAATVAAVPAPDRPFRVVPRAVEPARGAGVWVGIDPETPAEEARLRAFRDACAAAVGLAHRPGHAAYPFHITLAYAIAWPDLAEAEALDAALAVATTALREAWPVIEIGPPEVCRFADMTRFEPMATLTAA